MQRTVRKDNDFERSVRSLLHARGLRYRVHHPLPGLRRMTCDIAFPGLKIAVFLDGCFWHGCEIHPPSVKKNADFWLEKIERNRARDARAGAHLVEIGWTVLRFWEHEAADTIAEKITSAANAIRAKRSPHDRSGPLEDMQRPPRQFETVDSDVASIEAQLIE